MVGDGVRRPALVLVAHAALAAVAMLVVVWAGYRFSIGRLEDLPPMDYMGTPALAPPGQRGALMTWLATCGCPRPRSGTASCS